MIDLENNQPDPKKPIVHNQPVAQREYEEPSMMARIGAAIVSENPFYEMFSDRPDFKVDREFSFLDHMDEILESDYDIDDLFDAKSEEEMRWIMSKQDEVNEAKEIVARGGAWGTLGAYMAGGLTNPLNYVGGMATGSIKAMMFAEAAGVSLSEALLHSQEGQGSRTAEETALNIIAPVVLVGGLAAAGKSFRGELFIKNAADRERELVDIDLPENIEATSGINGVENQGDAGAAKAKETMEGNTMVGGKVMEKLSLGVNAKNLTSPFLAMRLFSQRMFENPYLLRKHLTGEGEVGRSVESEARELIIQEANVRRAIGDIYKQYKSGGGKMKGDEFYEAVGYALSHGDTHAIKEVGEAAKVHRAFYQNDLLIKIQKGEFKKEVAKVLKAEKAQVKKAFLKEHGAKLSKEQNTKLKEALADVDERHRVAISAEPNVKADAATKAYHKKILNAVRPSFAKSYFPRMYDRLKLFKNKDMFLSLVSSHINKGLTKGSMKLFDVEGVTYVVPKKDVKKWLKDNPEAKERVFDNNADKTRIENEANSKARDIYNRLVSVNPSERVTDQIKDPKQLLNRTLSLSDDDLRPFLITRADEVMHKYARENALHNAMFTRLGTNSVDEFITELQKEGKIAISKAKNAKEAERLSDRLRDDTKMMQDTLSILDGRYGLPSSYSLGVQAMQWTRFITTTSKLGGAVLTNMNELASLPRSYGLAAFAKGLTRILTSHANLSKEAKQAFGASHNSINASRAGMLFDVGDDPRVSKYMREGYRIYFNLNLINKWTDVMQGLTMEVASGGMIKWMRSGSLKQKAMLRRAGLSDDIQDRILKEYDRTGSLDYRDWTDAEAGSEWKGALLTEMRRNVVEPTAGDKPLWMHHEVGKFFSTFQSFLVASHNKMLLAGLQQNDANFWTGVLFSVALGDMLGWAKDEIRGIDRKDDTPFRRAIRGADRSGILGLFALPTMVAYNQMTGDVGGRAANSSAERILLQANMGMIVPTVADTIQLGFGDMTAEKYGKNRLRDIPLLNLFHVREIAQQLADNVEDE